MRGKTKTCAQSDNGDISLKNYAEIIAKREGFLKYDVKITKITQKGKGYLGSPYEIDIKGETADGEKEINLFVKNIIFAHDALGGFFSINDVYDRECFFYKELSNLFNQLQEGKVPNGERLNMVKGYEESTSETIIMDNLSKKGYQTPDRMDVASVKFLELSLEQLAKLHGLGFLMQKKMPEYFNNNKISEKYPLDFNEEWEPVAKSIIGVSLKNLNSETRKRVEVLVPTVLEKMKEYYNNDESTTRTLCHGDFRSMNLLMKEINGEVTEVIPIDYQFHHYGCPATDVLFLLYGCTDQKVRRQHLRRLINFYYDNLTRYLKYFNFDVNVVYPKKEFDAAIEKRSDFGLLSLYFFPIFFAPEKDAIDITEDCTTVDYKIDDEIMRRLEEIIEDCEEAGIL